MAKVVRIENLTKAFGSIQALDGVDMTIDIDETRAIIGPNGAGKTTLFSIISGALSPSTGRIYHKGDDITGLSHHAVASSGIVKTYQINNLFWELSVLENVRIAAQTRERLYDFTTDYRNLEDTNERCHEILEQVGLDDKVDALVDTLPYGDQRKLEIGIAIATDPSVLLLDEPTAGMEPGETDTILEIVNDLSAYEEASIVITEHDIDVILKVADLITVLHQGEVIAEGTAEEITSNERVQRVYLGEQ